MFYYDFKTIKGFRSGGTYAQFLVNVRILNFFCSFFSQKKWLQQATSLYIKLTDKARVAAHRAARAILFKLMGNVAFKHYEELSRNIVDATFIVYMHESLYNIGFRGMTEIH